MSSRLQPWQIETEKFCALFKTATSFRGKAASLVAEDGFSSAVDRSDPRVKYIIWRCRTSLLFTKLAVYGTTMRHEDNATRMKEWRDLEEELQVLSLEWEPESP